MLDMWYMPSEIADETGIAAQTIYKKYIPAGLPIKRDDTGHIWIKGAVFAAWVVEHNRTEKQSLQPDQAWCFACKAPVEMVGELTVIPTNKYLEMVHATCAGCGGKVTRARAKSRGQ